MRYKIIGIAAGALLLIPIGWQLGLAVAPLASSYAGLLGALGLAIGLLVALGVLRILFAYGRLASARARQAEIMPMQNGHLIHVDDVTRAYTYLLHTLNRDYDVREKAAAQPPALTHYHNEVHPALPAADPLIGMSGPPIPQLPGPSVDLASALDRGYSTPDRWLIGLDAGGQPQQAQLKHTGMIAISGVPGTGKTSAAAWLAAQTAAHGGGLFIADPHDGDDGSLSERIAGFDGAIARRASTPDAMSALILRVAAICDWRGAHPGTATRPIVLLIDEFMELMLRKQLSAEAERALITLSSAGRKRAIYGVLISQNWSANALGQRVTVLRQIVTGAIVHQSDEETARFLLPRGYAKQAATLQAGEVLWFGSGTPVQARVPYLSPSDVALAARRAASARPEPPAPQPSRVAPPPVPTPRQEVPPTVELPPPTVPQQILLLLDARPWLTSSAIAAHLGIDVLLVRPEISELYRRKALARRQAQAPGADKFEYRLARPINELAAELVALSA